MIVKEFYKEREDGVKLYRIYSNENYKIRQEETGNIYDEAIDIEEKNYTYKETEKKIEILEEREDSNRRRSYGNE